MTSVLRATAMLVLAIVSATRAYASDGAVAPGTGGNAGGSARGGPDYSLSADAAVGFGAASPGFDFTAAGTAALWTVSATFLHRFEGSGWGAVLNHTVDLSGSGVLPGTASAISGIVREAYADLCPDGALSISLGKRRMQMGVGTVFAPGDMINPRLGFWDQKDGFRGLALEGSVGADLSLRGALSLEGNLGAWAAALTARQALAAYGPADLRYTAAAATAAAALAGTAGPADPRLFIWGASADAQVGTLQMALGGNFRPNRIVRPSIGFSADIAGLIFQAEGAVELAGALGGTPDSLPPGTAPGSPGWYGTLGLRYTLYGGDFELTLAADGEYGGGRGLAGWLYLLPAVTVSIAETGSLTARALVDPEGGSALVSAILVAGFLRDFDIEMTGSFGIGAEGTEFSRLPEPLESMRSTLGLAARVHF